MTSTRRSGGLHDFVDGDNWENLEPYLGKHAKIGGKIKRKIPLWVKAVFIVIGIIILILIFKNFIK